MASIRAAGIHGFAAVVGDLGADPAVLLREVGLDPVLLALADVPVPDRQISALLEHAADVLGCPDVGLRMAARHDLTMLGPLALVLANCSTGAQALAATSRFLGHHADAITVTRLPDPEGDPEVVALRYQAHPGGPAPVQATDTGLGFLHRAIGMLLGDDYGLLSVDLPHAAPAGLAVYEAFFGAPVRLGDEALLRGPRDLLDRPVAGAQPVLREYAERHLALLVPHDADLVARVGAVAGDLLAYRSATVEVVAGALTLHPRTLQRRLAGRGTTYAEVVDRVREERAREMLTGTDLPFHEISSRLGFAEQATFTRACRRWWGVPPRTVRTGRTVAQGQVSPG